MKKQIYFIGILILLCGNVFALEPKLANQMTWWTGQCKDLNTGNDYLSLEHYDNFFNREKLKTVTISVTKTKSPKHDISRIFDSGGLLVKEEEKYGEKSIKTYKYDKKNRVVGYNDNVLYSYESDKERTIISKNKNGTETEKFCSIKELTNGYSVEENTPSSFSTSSATFEYDGDNLVKVIEKNEYGQYRKSTYINEVEYTYEAGLLKFIEYRVGENKRIDVRTEITKYDNNGNIMQLRRLTDYSKDKVYEYIYDFSDYDEHGNWHKYVCYCDGAFYGTATRDIEYW